MDIIFQLTGSLLLCYFVLTRSTKYFIAQSYNIMSDGKFDYVRTYSSIQEVYLTKAGILNITLGYILTFIKVQNFIKLLSQNDLQFYLLNILALGFLLVINLFIVKKLAKIKTNSMQKDFDFEKNMETGKWYMRIEEAE